MSPEERFTKIENYLTTVAEQQASHDERIATIEDLQIQRETQFNRWVTRFAETQQLVAGAFQRLAEAQKRTDEAQQRNEEAQRLAAEARKGHEDAQRISEEKLNALIDTVDRIIRREEE